MESPSSRGPRISRLEVPDRATAGCPVTIRFHFEAPTGGIVRVLAGWALRQRRITASGYAEVPLDPRLYAGKTVGEVVAPLTLDRYGTYWYYVQVQDGGGQWSNVLREGILVHARMAETPDCS
jgi:hypothetical protein